MENPLPFRNNATLVIGENIKKFRELENPLWPLQDPPNIEPFWFETCDIKAKRQWVESYWWFSLVLSAVYLVMIFGGRKVMSKRPAFNLQKSLVVWNFMLAAFSLCGLARLAPELFQVLSWPSGFHRSVCYRENFNVSSCWWGKYHTKIFAQHERYKLAFSFSFFEIMFTMIFFTLLIFRLGIHALKSGGTWRYSFHCVTETTFDFPPLVCVVTV